MTKRINKILWNGTEVPKASTQADGLDGLNLGELFIKNDPEEPGVYTRTTDGKVVLLGGGIDKYLHRLFVAIDANGREIAPNDLTTPIASVRVNYGLWTEQFLSAKGMNPDAGSGGGGGGATKLGGLINVTPDADLTHDVAKMLVLEAKSNLWTLKNLSDLVGGLDESELAAYLTNNNYAKKSDIPSLSGYATEQWVLGKGYATTSDLDDRIDALVNGAPQAYDTLKEIADVLGKNVDSVADILDALGTKADKATTLSGYGITDAYTIAQIDSIVNGLSGNISTLQGYFTDGVANSALKLSDNGSYTAWGQTFFTKGKPKSLSGALTDVTDITSSGTITTNKIVIGNGTIEWDEANKGFKVTGLYSTTYLSSKGANPNSGSTPSGNQYTRLDTWDGYTSAMDVWVLSAKLGKGLYDTQNSLITRVGALEGKATNVSFTQSLTSGTQIGSISIDGVVKNIYAPTIPTKLSQFTNDLGLGTFAYKSSLAFADLTDKPTTLSGYGITDWSVKFGDYNVNERYDAGYYAIVNGSNAPTHANYGSLLVMPYRKASGTTMPDFATQIFLPNGDDSGYPNDMFFRTSLGSSWNAWQRVITDNNYTNYIYSKSTIDTKLSGYLPLSGGTLSNSSFGGALTIHRSQSGNNSVIKFTNIDGDLGYIGVGGANGAYPNQPMFTTGGFDYGIIHSGNIGSQSVASAKRLVTSDGKSVIYSSGTIFYVGDTYYTEQITDILGKDIRLRYGTSASVGFILNSSGYVGIGTTNPKTKLDVEGALYNRASHYIYNSADRTDRLCLAWNNGTACIYSIKADGSSYNSLRLGTTADSNRQLYYDNSTGNWGVGTSTPQYKLDVNSTLHASGAVSFDGILAVGGATRIDGNVAIGNGSDGNKLYVYGVVRSAAYNAIGNNNAAFVFDKPGSNYTGIGANGVADTIYFGACSVTGAWITDYLQKWHFNGEVYAKTGVWSDGYVSAKGQNTSSDVRLKNILNVVVLNVRDIANAPSIRFAWKNGGGIDVGSSAQYWQGLLPDAVKEREGRLEMQYANIALLSAIALAKRSESHEERIARLERENKELKQRIVILEGGSYA